MEVLPVPPGPSGVVDVVVRPGGERRRRSSGVVRVRDGGEGAVEPQPARELREAAWGQILRVHHEGAGLARVATAPLRMPPFEVGIHRPHVLLDLVQWHASRSAEGGRDRAALRRDIPARIEHNPRAREQPVDEIEPVGVPRREVRHPFRPFLPLARAGQRHQLFEAEDLLLTAAALVQVVVGQLCKDILHRTEHVRGQLLVLHLERRRVPSLLQLVGSVNHLPCHVYHGEVLAS
mmetsp:Transcript_48407/g.116413  ORF Transcript_48407/g.116413 Transcript_48407/m.116413 type:complete len:235 (-) Transcript_48407:215-919(-)